MVSLLILHSSHLFLSLTLSVSHAISLSLSHLYTHSCMLLLFVFNGIQVTETNFNGIYRGSTEKKKKKQLDISEMRKLNSQT